MQTLSQSSGSVSLSVDLPLTEQANTSWLARTMPRLNAVRQRFSIPMTWVWDGNAPSQADDVRAVSADASCDFGWHIPTSTTARQQFRTEIIGQLKHWRAAAQALRMPLQTVVTSESKIAIPYDVLVEAGVKVRRDLSEACSSQTRFAQPRQSQTGLWQMPVHTVLHLQGGWLTTMREMRRIQAVQQVLRSSQAFHLHICVVIDTAYDLSSRAMGYWEQLLHFLAGLRAQQGTSIDTMANLIQSQLPVSRRPSMSILRAA
jgi:hypothetical protein